MFHSLFQYSRNLLLTLVILSAGQAAIAEPESSKSFGPFDVHYSVFYSTFLQPDVARALQITRGKNRALINISVRKNHSDGRNTAKKAIVTGYSTDLMRRYELEFEEIEEQGAIYYLAPFSFADKDLRTFNIQVQPDPNVAPYQLKFSRTLYHEE